MAGNATQPSGGKPWWALAVLLAVAGLSRADEPAIVLVPKPETVKPIEFKTAPGVSLKLAAAGDAVAKWSLVGDFAQAEIIPCDAGKTCTFIAPEAGYYYLQSVVGERQYSILVIVGKPDVPEPMPPPKPVPVPPVPPKPVPVPVDPLLTKLQAAYLLDLRPDARRRQDLLDLIELYGQASALAAKPEIKSISALITQIRTASTALGIVGLVDLRRAIGVELSAGFPADDPLTDETRKHAGDTFARIQAALKGVTK